MATITEDYVSFETAKLLKEKGFDSGCISYYEYFRSNITLYQGFLPEWSDGYVNHNKEKERFSRPSLQMACKWLRIKHNLCVTPIMTSKVIREKYSCWEADIYYCEGEFAGIDATINACGHIFGETPEKALEEGVKYCLENLI